MWSHSVFQVVEQGMFVKHCKVEVYLTELKLCENGNMNNVVTRRFSKADTIGIHNYFLKICDWYLYVVASSE